VTNIVFDVEYFEEEEASTCKNGGSIGGNGADRHRRHHGVRALASVYEKIFEGATRYQESAGESIFYNNVLL
jgi:hypothetical protein